jgi:hypothetical protein
MALGAGALVLVLVVLGAAHTSAGRSLVWSWIRTTLGARGIDVRAEGFDYNLFTLDIRVRGVELSVPTRTNSPFLAADLIRVRLPLGILLGRRAAESIEVVKPRVQLRRDADGTSNWPVSAGSAPGNGPVPLDLGTVQVRGLDVAINDEQMDQVLDVRAVSLDLPPLASGRFGTLELGGRAEFRTGNRAVVLTRLNGAIRFDGTNLWLRDLRVETATDRLQFDGRVDALLDTPRLGLTYRGAVGLKAVSTWIDVPGTPTGEVGVEGSIEGPLSEPDVALSVTGEQLAWLGLRNLSLRAAATWRPGAIDVNALTLRIGSGELSGTSHVVLSGAPQPSRANLAWRDLSLATLQPAIPLELPFGVGGLMDGHLDARWTGPRLASLVLTLQNQANGAAAAGRLAVDGSIGVEIADLRWQARIDTVIGRAVRILGSAGGQLSADDPRASTLSGSVAATAADLGAARDLLNTLSRSQSDTPVSLTGEATVDLSLRRCAASGFDMRRWRQPLCWHARHRLAVDWTSSRSKSSRATARRTVPAGDSRTVRLKVGLTSACPTSPACQGRFLKRCGSRARRT